MKRKTCSIYFLMLISLVLTSCWEDRVVFPEATVNGYKPIYATGADLAIVLKPAIPVVTTGKIYVIGDLLLLNERYKGIHIIDNTDPSSPKKVGFLQIQGATEMAVRNNVLYTNQYGDLVAIDFSDLDNITVLSREEDVLSINGGNQVPPVADVYFECIDTTKGVVIGWEEAMITNPKCYY